MKKYYCVGCGERFELCFMSCRKNYCHVCNEFYSNMRIKELEKQLELRKMDNEKCFTEKDVEGLIKDREETIKFLKQQLSELELKNDKLGTDLCNADDLVSYLQKQLVEKEEQLKNAIVPKFKINEDVYIIWNGMIIDVEIKAIGKNEYYVDTCHFDLADGYGGIFVEEDEIFKTHEEAERATNSPTRR